MSTSMIHGPRVPAQGSVKFVKKYPRAFSYIFKCHNIIILIHTISVYIETDRQTDTRFARSNTDLVADAALVRLLAAVRELVVLVVALLVESLAAELAGEGLVAGVDAGVRVERRAAVERFTARVASVRFLLGVYDLVSAER